MSESKKEIAQSFLKLVVGGKIKEAYDLYIDEQFRHHNPYFEGDKDSLMHGMQNAHIELPNKIYTPLRALEDDYLVAVHGQFQKDDKDVGMSVMHIFRFNEDKIIEMWDFGQEVPKDMINKNGMF